MNVLVADKFEAQGIEKLKKAGCNVIYEAGLADGALRDAVVRSKCRVLIVRSTKVTKDVIEAGDALGLIVRAGAGVNTIDTAAASRNSVLVANCPGKNAIAVAELAFGLILALDRRIVENTVDLREGRWNKKEYSQAAGLKGRTLGIIGLGQIGEAVAERARAFGMKVVAWSRSLTPERADELDIMFAESPRAVASKCDVLSIHLAAAPETKKLVNADVLGALKPGATVINTARAEVMDYDALAKVMAEKKLRVGLDVYPHEPSASQGEFADAIVKAGGIVYGTHHIGASTEQAQMAIADETVRIVRDYLLTGRVHSCVNISAKTPAKYTLSVRHFNKPGVLAHTLNLVSHAGVNVEEMENIICDGLEAAVAQIKLEAPLAENVLRDIKQGNPHVIAVAQTQIS